MKNKTKFLLTTLFILVAFLLLSTTNVKATTVEVETEQQLIDAVDGIKEVDGSKVSDTDTTVVKLVDDIELTKNLGIKAITDLTLDLNGHSLSGETNSKDVYIMYGSNTINSGSLTIKDTSVSNLGTIKSYKPIIIYNNSNDTSASYKLTIDGGKFYNLYWGNIFELNSSNYALDFIVNDGYFEYNGTNAIFLHAGDMITNNRTLTVQLNKLTMKNSNARLVYSAEKDFKVNDVVSEDSKINLKYSLNGKEAEITDRNVSVTEINALNRAWATALGESSLSYYFDTLVAGATDETSYTIKAKTGLNAGTYTAVITVTDANDKTYTSTVKVVVAKKTVEGLGATAVIKKKQAK